MSTSSKKEYLSIQAKRYRGASREKKSRILDEAQEILGMHRKSLIRALGRRKKSGPSKAGRPSLYGPEVIEPLKNIWRCSRQPCSKRLHVVIRTWLPYYAAHFEPLDPEVERKLLTISPSTIDRLLIPIRPKAPKLHSGLSVNTLKGQIPIRQTFSQVPVPGYMEVDTVAHGGGSTCGTFMWSISYVDIWSGWTENRALWNRNQRQVVRQTTSVEAVLPFYLQGFDTDNGPEFINNALFKFLRTRSDPIEFTRARPYHKNDNAHVEQRQFTHVRELLGYDRFDYKPLVRAVNDLYENEWRLLQNFFMPSMQLEAKWREGSKIRRRHNKPLAPCERLLQCDAIRDEVKEELCRIRDTLNPFELNASVENQLRNIMRRLRRWKQKKNDTGLDQSQTTEPS